MGSARWSAVVLLLALSVAISAPVSSNMAPLVPVALAEVMPPPGVGAVVAEDPLTEIGVFRPDFCATGRGSSQFTADGFKMSINGPCVAALSVATITAGLNGVTMNDGEVELEVGGSGPVERAMLQFYVRLQGGGSGYNGYQVTWRPSQGVAELQRLKEGRGTSLARQADLPPISLADGARIGLRTQGPTFWLLVNGEPFLSGTDPAADAIDTGRVGLALFRDGSVDDDAELSVTWRNLRLSRLADGEQARAPTFQRPTSSQAGPFVPPSGKPPEPGASLYQEPLNRDMYGPTQVGMFYPRRSCPTGNGSVDFVEEGLKLEAHGECYANARTVRVSALANPSVDVPDGEIRFNTKIANGYRRAAIVVMTRVDTRLLGEDSGYAFVIIPSRGIATIIKVGNGEPAVLGRKSGVDTLLARDDWNTVTIRLLGSKLWLLLNDTPVLAADDGAIKRGSFTMLLERIGQVEGEESVEVLFRDLVISEIKGAPKDRRPTSSFYMPGSGR